MSQWVITGAAGFLGEAVLRRLVGDGKSPPNCARDTVIGVCRNVPKGVVPNVRYLQLGDLGDSSRPIEWRRHLLNVDVVVHAAARVHIMKDGCVNPLAEFRRVNVDATLRLANQAAAAGVKRLVFISSIGVNGQCTAPGSAFKETDKACPHNEYSQSKHEAEQGLIEIANRSNLEVVIIRPPLVYGPNAPGNFGSLVRAVKLGIPLPLALVRNQRSFVFLGNLVDFIVTCAVDSHAANQTFLVSDGDDLSAAQLIRKMAQSAGKSDRLWPMAIPLLNVGARIFGKAEAFQRVCGNLQVDISKAKNLLNWSPPCTVDEGIKISMQGVVR